MPLASCSFASECGSYADCACGDCCSDHCAMGDGPCQGDPDEEEGPDPDYLDEED
jgi:hypothetical protein